MPIVYLKLSVSISGVEITEQVAIDFLRGWVKAETLAGLKGNNRGLFRFHDIFESDVEVELIEYTGNLSGDEKPT